MVVREFRSNLCMRGIMSTDTIYQARNETLKEMGFASYKGYLASDIWSRIRKAVLERDGGQCRICIRTFKKGARAVHHLSYSRETLEGKKLDNLIAVCHYCHHRMEFDITEPDRKLSAEKVFQKTKSHLNPNTKRHKSKPWIGLAHKYKHRNRR